MMSTSSSDHESVRVAALGQATLSTRRRIAAAAGLGLLAVLSLWLLIAARLEWLVVPIPLLLLAIALGLLLRREWAPLAVRIVIWPIFVVVGGVCAYHLLADRRPWEDGALIAMIYPLLITSGWALFWLGDFAALRHFRVKHLLVLTAVVAVSFGVLSMADFGEKATAAVLSMLFEAFVIFLLYRSASAFRTPGVIQTRGQALEHAIALAVLWIFPVTWLCAATIGVPAFGWQRGLGVAVLTPVLLLFYGMMGGWVMLPVLAGLGWLVGDAWWKQEHPPINTATTTVDTPASINPPGRKPRLLGIVLGLGMLAFIVCFVLLVIMASL